jgi:hypothetical protein
MITITVNIEEVHVANKIGVNMNINVNGPNATNIEDDHAKAITYFIRKGIQNMVHDINRNDDDLKAEYRERSNRPF